MLKNKFKLISILAVLIILFTVPIVRADNGTNNVNSIDTTNTTDTNVEQQIANTDLKRDNVYLIGDDVVIDYNIDGNVFVLANNVTINSNIGGDVFVCAGNLTISQQSFIYSNLFVAAQNVIMNGIVNDVYSISNNISINGCVYRDIRLSSNTINLSGIIGRNAYVQCDNLNLIQKSEEVEETSNNTIIIGNLNYSAKQEASIPDGSISGQINFEKVNDSNKNTISNYIVSLVTFVITVVAIWLVLLWLAPNFLKNTATLITSKKILPVLGLGILTPIVLIILSILFLIFGLTSTLGLLLLVILFILIAISTSIFVITINNVICNKLKLTKNITILGALIPSACVLWLIGLIPYVGTIISLIAVILGLGIITYSTKKH